MKHKSVIDLVKTLGSKRFYCIFLLSNIQNIFRNYNSDPFRQHACSRYQEYCRIYLDEYEDQKELREEYFDKTKFTFKKLQEWIKIFTSVGYEVKDFSFCSFDYYESDGYFVNRWLKRN